MILAMVAMCICGSTVFAEPVLVHSNLPPDTEFETNIVAEVWSVGAVSFAKMFCIRITLPAVKKFDAAVLAVLLTVCTVVAQKGTNDPPRGAVASGSNYWTIVSTLVRSAWNKSDGNNERLWPNHCPLDNKVPPTLVYPEWNFRFTEPYFLHFTTKGM